MKNFFRNNLSPRNYISHKMLGFTLIEMVVCVAIITIITAVALYNNSKFSNDIEISNIAYETAVVIREAQTYSLGVKNTNSGSIKGWYGVYFDKNLNYFYLFADLNQDGQYNTGEEIEKYNFRRQNHVESFCLVDNPTNCINVNGVSIVFVRPKPNANIFPTSFGNGVLIKLSSGTNMFKKVLVYKSGQISVQ